MTSRNMFMDHHSREEFEKNEREMMDLFRQMTWCEQCVLIGRMMTMIELSRQKMLIQFPVDH